MDTLSEGGKLLLLLLVYCVIIKVLVMLRDSVMTNAQFQCKLENVKEEDF